MEQVTLSAQPRAALGTRASRRLRRQGLVPATVYGKGTAAKSILVSGRDLYSVLHTEAGRNALINVDIEGDGSVLAVAREAQRHPVRGEVIHLDLIQISMDEAISAEVALEYVGTPIGVREDGGFVEAIATTVNISALPGNIPGSIVVNIEDMETGDTLKVSDLPEVEGVEYTDDEDRALVTVLLPRAEEVLEEAAELGAEGELLAAPVEAGAPGGEPAGAEEEE